MRCDLSDLCALLRKGAYAIILPGQILIVDESLYEFNGVCPVRRYIPRKPHPNGLLVYALAGYFNVAGFQFPFVLDFEPYILENLVGAQDAMMALYNRLLERKPTLYPHLVVDSAFGSFEKLRDIVNTGGNATMSMPSTTKPWLWELLDFGCGIDEGRLALLPLENIIVSSYKVLTETGNEHQIKTISSGCTLKVDSADEELVSLVTERRGSGAKSEYLTKFKDGHTEWLSAHSFIDDNGVVNLSWLQFVNSEELSAVFESYTHAQLKVTSLGPRSFVGPSLRCVIGNVCCSRLESDWRQVPSA